MKLDLPGIVPAVYTPMLENGDINLDTIDEYVTYLCKADIKNIFVLGSAGEGCSLSNEERMQVAEKWVSASAGRIPNVIVHVGTANLADTKILAKHAEKIGATAIATVASFFFRPTEPKQLALYLAEVAKAAPKTPLMYYHIPLRTKVNLPAKPMLDELSAMDVKNFAGLKFSEPNLCDLGQCIQDYGDRYTFGFGCDEQVMAGLLMGADTCVGSTYNYALKLYQRIFDACKRGDVKTARELQYKSQKYITHLVSVGFDVGVDKAVMTLVSGIEMGPPRLPMLPPSEEKMQRIMDSFRQMGFFDWVQ